MEEDQHQPTDQDYIDVANQENKNKEQIQLAQTTDSTNLQAQDIQLQQQQSQQPQLQQPGSLDEVKPIIQQQVLGGSDGQLQQNMIQGQVDDPNQSEEIKQETDEDKRSVFVQNVDYATQKEDIRQHFIDCGEIVRITIQKGYAYIEFKDSSQVELALQLSDSVLRGRTIKVQRKRTNIRNFKPSTRPRRRGRGRRISMITPFTAFNSLLLCNPVNQRRFGNGFNQRYR